MTLTTILADCYRRLGFEASPDSKVTTRLTAFLNETHRQLLSIPGMERLRRSTVTFASVANQSHYALPPVVSRALSVVDASNRITLREQSWSWYRTEQPDSADPTGTPEVYVPYGLAAVSKQPSNASKVYVDSTSASDTQVCYVEGYRTGGYFVSKSIAMTGNGCGSPRSLRFCGSRSWGLLDLGRSRVADSLI